MSRDEWGLKLLRRTKEQQDTHRLARNKHVNNKSSAHVDDVTSCHVGEEGEQAPNSDPGHRLFAFKKLTCNIIKAFKHAVKMK